VGQVVEVKSLSVGEVEGDLGTGIAPGGAETAKLFGLDGEREFAEFGGADGHGGVGVGVVIDIDSGEDVGGSELKIGVMGCRIRDNQRECAELSVGRTNMPFAFSPIDEAGGILADERRSGGKMGIVEGDVGGRDAVALSLDVDVAGSGVAAGEGVSGGVEGVVLLFEVFARGRCCRLYESGAKSRPAHVVVGIKVE
jgi:hypothetical protein